MTEIYIAFVDTPGIFASIIRRVIKQKYIHVAIGLDENLDEAYSIGRRHPSIPLIAGFEKEEKRNEKKNCAGISGSGLYDLLNSMHSRTKAVY